MVQSRFSELLAQRTQLRSQIAGLRLTLADHAQPLRAPLALADRAQATALWLYRHPQWPLGVLVALGLLRPQRAVGWVGRVWWGWTVFRRAQRWLAATTLRRP